MSQEELLERYKMLSRKKRKKRPTQSDYESFHEYDNETSYSSYERE